MKSTLHSVILRDQSPFRSERKRHGYLSAHFLCIIVAVVLTFLSANVAVASPPTDGNPILPLTYVQIVADNAPVFAFPPDAKDDLLPVRTVGAGFMWVSLAETDPVTAGGRMWYHLNPDGYIAAEYVKPFQPSAFAGISLAAQPDKPFGWVVYGVRVSSAPGTAPAKNAVLLARYSRITILGAQKVGDWIWYRIGDNQWVEQRQVGIVTPSPRPDGVAPGDKWIDVNLYEQTLAAYEGNRMVYATLVSSGLPYWPTPTGLFRIWVKATSAKMSGRDEYPDYYFLEDVPWIMYFDESVALHAAYWHDRFGAPHSHGCVNLSPQDAFWLFNWTTPGTGPGTWTLAKPDNPGTWVWVH